MLIFLRRKSPKDQRESVHNITQKRTKEKKRMWRIFDAICNENFEEVKYMVNENPQCVHGRNCIEWTPLDEAIAHGNLEIAKYLWNMGGRPNLEIYHNKEWTPVHGVACFEHTATTLKWIFTEGGVLPLRVLNIKSDSGWTALDYAIAYGSLEMVQFLWEKGRRPRLEIYTWTLLDIAIAHGRLETAKFLWEKDEQPNLEIYDDDGTTPVHDAVRSGHIETLKWAFAKNIISLHVLNIKNSNGLTPLDVAIARGRLEIAKLLWEMDGLPNLGIYCDRERSTPVHGAALNGHTSTLKWAFTEKVLPLHVLNVKDYSERTPLVIAISESETAVLLRRLPINPVFLAMQRAKRDYQCVLRRLPNELLDMVVDEVALRFDLKVVWC